MIASLPNQSVAAAHAGTVRGPGSGSVRGCCFPYVIGEWRTAGWIWTHSPVDVSFGWKADAVWISLIKCAASSNGFLGDKSIAWSA